MDTLQVFKALQSNLWQPHQSIVLPIDLLKRQIKTYPFSAVVNLDHSSGAGTHWVAIFLEECSKFDIPDYFCSYSSDIPHEIQEFFRKNYGENGVAKAAILPFQNINAQTCALWAIDFIVHRSCGVKTEDYIMRFSRDTVANECILRSRWAGDIDNLKFKYFNFGQSISFYIIMAWATGVPDKATYKAFVTSAECRTSEKVANDKVILLNHQI